jgi:hypothetical protein
MSAPLATPNSRERRGLDQALARAAGVVKAEAEVELAVARGVAVVEDVDAVDRDADVAPRREEFAARADMAGGVGEVGVPPRHGDAVPVAPLLLELGDEQAVARLRVAEELDLGADEMGLFHVEAELAVHHAEDLDPGEAGPEGLEGEAHARGRPVQGDVEDALVERCVPQHLPHRVTHRQGPHPIDRHRRSS